MPQAGHSTPKDQLSPRPLIIRIKMAVIAAENPDLLLLALDVLSQRGGLSRIDIGEGRHDMTTIGDLTGKFLNRVLTASDLQQKTELPFSRHSVTAFTGLCKHSLSSGIRCRPVIILTTGRKP